MSTPTTRARVVRSAVTSPAPQPRSRTVPPSGIGSRTRARKPRKYVSGPRPARIDSAYRSAIASYPDSTMSRGSSGMRSVSEVPPPGHDDGHAPILGHREHLLIADRAPGVDHGRHPGVRRDLDRV